MSETIRETGYYWVKKKHLPDLTGWQVAFYSELVEAWLVVGIAESRRDKDFSAINETRILNPDEREKQ